MQERELAANLVKITPLSSHDGPGLRTTVFFKGCPLHCRWCHNPETIHPFPELKWTKRDCIGCRQCEKACKNGAIDFSLKREYVIDTDKCIRCFSCVEHCPSKALSIIGHKYSPQTLSACILKDEALLKSIDGGVTFSGGEPALYPDFITVLARKLKERDLHLALDTCGQVSSSAYERMLPFLDLLLFDIKEINPERHIAFTGKDNRRVIDNLHIIAGLIRKSRLHTRIWVRTPLIPGMTASVENIAGIGKLLNDSFSDLIDKWELCAFNNMCADKYTELGLNRSLATVPLLTNEEMAALLDTAKKSAGEIKQITASGLIKQNSYDD